MERDTHSLSRRCSDTTDRPAGIAANGQSGAVPHLIIGTKAQFIKMAPIAVLLERLGRPYRILDLSQHGSLTGQILGDFGLRPDLAYVLPTGTTVGSYSQMASWVTRAVRELARPAAGLASRLLRSGSAVALVHGDTLSTLLGLYLAKRLRIPVGLVEAGLSSGSLLNPFPEEMVRRHVEQRVQLLFPPDETSAQRLRERRLRGSVRSTQYNTGRDALLLMAQRAEITIDAPRTVLTLHRAETLGRPRRLTKVVAHLEAMAKELAPVTFFLHEPTDRALRRIGVLDRLQSSPHIRLRPLASYPEFVANLVHASFILTDGGSIQEEASYLNKPCLVLRETTERMHGIGTTAALTSFDLATDLAFLRSVHGNGAAATSGEPSFSAAEVIVEALDEKIGAVR